VSGASGSWEPEAARRYLVSGRVQGVGFRWFAREAARGLGLRGAVRNLVDGRVEAHAAGPAEALARFAETLRRGPRGSWVVELVEEELARLDEPAEGFHIVR
jgi:acylphosphatase